MGKRVKKKGRIPHKEKRVVTVAPKIVPQENSPAAETVDDGVLVAKERKLCAHIDKGVDLVKLAAKFRSLEPIRCEDCREGVVDRRGGKGKGKHGKSKGGGSIESKLDSKAIWVCLECGHYACGGVGFPTTPQSHAVRHAKQNRHPLAIQLDNTHLRWCFPCNTLIPVEKSEENGEQKDILLDAVKLMKGRSTEGASVDVEDVWFGGGSVRSETISEGTMSSLDGRGGYVVRGLANLGNTCFLNSVMQNLLAMDRLRAYFLNMDGSVGPLCVSLKKLVIETNPEAGLRNVINPKSFFGCVCAKAPQFRGFHQHDSHELLRCLLDGLCTEELAARKLTNSSRENGISPSEGPTFVDAIFGGQISSSVCCTECGHTSVVYEPFLDLSLPVPTKKPPKKAQPVSRARKMKVPPKRAARIRSKANKDVDLEPAQSVSNSSASCQSSHNIQPGIPVAEMMVASSGDSTRLDFIGPAASGEVSHQEQSAVPVSEKMMTASDDCTWLDFIGPSTMADDEGSVSQSFLVTQEFEDKQVFENVTEETSALLDGSTRLDYLETGTGSDDRDVASPNDDISGIQDSGNKNIVQNGVLIQNSSESNDQICLPSSEPNLKLNSSSGNSWEDELPLQVQSSEILLLPYKEEIPTTGAIIREGEASSLVTGYEEDSLDFDGFGGLFNEPEIALGPSVKPFLDDNNFQENVTNTGVVAGNISESDPDEVDNTDSPVSVESCLAYFTKPELLSNEHAWHCENCSKILQQQRMKAKKNRLKSSKIWVIGGEASSENDALGVEKDFSCPTEVRELNNGNINSDTFLDTSSQSLVVQNGKIDDSNNCSKHGISHTGEMNSIVSQRKEGKGEMKDVLLELSPSGCFRTCSQASSSDQASDSCSVNEPSCVVCNSDKFRQSDSSLLAGEPESAENEDEEMDSESVKVKRDATKRFLINKAPPILTIHLKRFTQDARGRLSKLNGHVNFQDTIDLRPYMDPRCIERDKYDYHLVGVVEHSGTMRGGHYVAYVRGSEKSMRKVQKENAGFVWYHASDAYVREVSLEEVLRCEAYILFYEKN
ncbi:hypothetical protein L1049_016320 [Liquidambar formosana]|uniref:ubiquitinyl hydrolase 1 n=1 Tax=Liquidambar formosana TaxID=63359 RepID=A0AAP0S151_LIQFO